MRARPAVRYHSRFLGTCLLGAVLALPGVGQAGLLDDLPAGTGYTAWEVCSRVLQGGDDYFRVVNAYTSPKVQPLPWIWKIDLQRGQQVLVRTRVPFLWHTRTAVHRPGLGCTLIPPGVEAAAIREQRFTPLSPPAPSPDRWPRGEGAAEEAKPVLAELLDRHAEAIFSETADEPGQRQNTIAFLVAHEGRLLYERYASGYQRDQAQLGWSMTKSLTALIAAAMHTDGLLDLEAAVKLPQWAGSDKAAISWKQLLNMAPGLAWNEEYGGASDATEMLFSQPDQGSWAASRPLVAKPGSVFNYSTGFSHIAMLRMKQILGGHQALYDYYQQRLLLPLGIRGGVIEPDASGTPAGGSRGMLRPVDWLRLGQLVAQRGEWLGEQLLDAGTVDFILSPSPASEEYGGSVWLLNSRQVPEEFRSRLPEDTVIFAGHMGQTVVIVPSRNLVVLRMGVTFDRAEERRRVYGAVADLVERL